MAAANAAPVDSERLFCELVRRLAPVAAKTPEEALDALGKRLRFRGEVGYANPGREVVRLLRSPACEQSPRQRIEVYVNRFVVAGIFGPLPEPYQELAARRAADGDHATRAFFDLFNHRVNLLRFWIQARHQPGLAGLQPAQMPLVRLAVALADGSVPSSGPAATPACPLPARCLVGLTALLRHPHRSVDCLQAALLRLLGMPLEILPFRGGWLRRHAEGYSLLGGSKARLGRSAILGRRYWDPGKGIELRLFPESHAQFEALLPGGPRHLFLSRLLRWLTRRQFDVQVVCAPPRASAPRLGRLPRLGYTARLSPNGAEFTSSPVRFTIYAEEPAGAQESA